MNREIKFRVWDIVDKTFTYLDIDPPTIGTVMFSTYPGRKIYQ